MRRKLLFLSIFFCVSLLPFNVLRSQEDDGDHTGIGKREIEKIKNKYKEHRDADPLSISGSIGGSVTSVWNDQRNYDYNTPFQATAFANFMISSYGFQLPININLMNMSMEQFTFPHPTLSASFTPTWKNLRFHLGMSSMHFSNYTYSGLNFTGAGVEYNGKWLRAAAFYGTLNRATRLREYDDRSAFRQYADSLLGLNLFQNEGLQYKRTAYGAKIGFGSTRNYIDFSFLKAWDDTTSLDKYWRTLQQHNDTLSRRDSTLTGKSNLDVGIAAKVSIGKWLSLTTNMGASVYTDDVSVPEANSSTLSALGVDTTGSDAKKYLKILDKFSPIYQPHLNTQVRFAGDGAANFNFGNVTGMVNYRFVQPDYVSLGANRFSQNMEGMGGNLNVKMFRGRSFISVFGFLQHDNLNGKQSYTNRVKTYTLNWNNNITNNFMVGLSYNGLGQYQDDGTQQVDENARINQRTSTFNISPVYNFDRGLANHSISATFNTVRNRDRNEKKADSLRMSVSTLVLGMGYSIGFPDLGISVGVNYDFTKSENRTMETIDSNAILNNYNANTISIHASYDIVKSNDITLKANYNGSFGFNKNTSPQQNYGLIDDEQQGPRLQLTRDNSISNRIGASFSYKKRHNASFFFSMSNYRENIIIGQKITTKLDARLNFTYTYTFAHRIIKSKRKTETKPIIAG